MEGVHGIYLQRDDGYDNGPNGDNWSYIDTKTMRIMDYRPLNTEQHINMVGAVVAGPFRTLNAAKAAFVLIYGR
jgi:hypothetical protein